MITDRIETRNMRGARRHSQQPGRRLPFWMMCQHSLDDFNRIYILRKVYPEDYKFLSRIGRLSSYVQ